MKKSSIQLRSLLMPTGLGLRESSKRRTYADAVFMSIGDGAIATNEEGRVSQINQAALQILGLKEEDIMGQWFQKVMRAMDENGKEIDLMERPITKAILSGEPVSARMYYETRHRGNVPVFVTVSPIIYNGRPNGAVEVFRDITVEEEIDRMKSDFISLASHQLRTPLTAISTYTHMLEQGFKGPVNEGQREFLETILASSDRMNDLIDTLLSVSRLESGNVTVNAEQVDVSEAIKTTKQELWPLAKAKSQYLITNAPNEPVIIETDSLLLTEVFTNLISNAIKYTPPEGKIVITLTTTNDAITLAVADNGYGIPQELQSRVFTKFFRSPNILHEEAVGTGLGLYLVKQIVENNLGGQVSFASKVGKGTTFTVKLPKALPTERSGKLRIDRRNI